MPLIDSTTLKPDGSGIYRLVCQTNHSMRMPQSELEAHPAWCGFAKEAGKHPPLRGWLAVPLIGYDGRNIVLLQLSDKYEGEFTEDDETTLVQLAQRLLLNLNVKTVESHRLQVMERLNIHDIVGLVRYAIRIGLVSVE